MDALKDRLGGTLVIATHNPGKLREIADLLAPSGLTFTSAGALGLAEPEETGSTFEDNAAIKAQAAMKATGMAALSDDSGLCVEGLGGEPGIHSARWAGADKDFSGAMERIRSALDACGAESRRAFFVAVLALSIPGEGTRLWRGEVHGDLVFPPRGDKGFGYDPIFRPDGYQRSFGEMAAEEKHGWRPGMKDALSHRARAFKAFWSDLCGEDA